MCLIGVILMTVTITTTTSTVGFYDNATFLPMTTSLKKHQVTAQIESKRCFPHVPKEKADTFITIPI